jgi:Domain found in Dishevelled, Egl-10, and Pleckstrin (DEP)
MLSLKESQIQFQDVIDPNSDRPIPIVGVVYQNKLFKKLKSFPKDKLESAQQLTRQLSLDPKVVCLMLEEADNYTIWSHDSKLKSYDAAQVDRLSDPIGKIDLKDLVRQMRDIGGVKIKDRRYRLNVYPRCMVGSEMTTWLVRKFFLAEADAVKLGQRLIDEKLLHHVTDSHPFEDGFFFYRFYWDE